MFRAFLAAVLVVLAPLAALGQSNAEPSLHVSLNPCVLFSGSLSANTRVDITTANVCNISAAATAVDVAVTVAASGSGSLKLWEYDGLEPSASVMSYGSGTFSSFGSPRACAPWGECLYGISAKSTAAITLTLTAVGYYVPPE